MTLMDAGSGRYNLASGAVYSIRQLVELISRSYPEVSYRWNPSKPLGQLRRSYDVSALERLGFSCEFTLETGLKATVSWVRDNLEQLRT